MATFGDVMRDIGRALGLGGGSGKGTGPGANAGGLGVMGGPSTGSLGLPFGNAPSKPSMIGGGGNGGDGPKPKPKPKPTPTPTPTPTPAPTPTPTPPAAPAPVVPGSTTSTGAVEDAALESAQQGLASTIATSTQGLLVEEEPMGLLRRRRSLLSGGLIQ